MINISGQEQHVHVDVQLDVTQVSDTEQFGMQCSLQGEQQQSDSGIHNPCHCFHFITRECNETSIAGNQKALTRSLARSLDFVKHFIYGTYNVPYYNVADQCIRLSPW